MVEKQKSSFHRLRSAPAQKQVLSAALIVVVTLLAYSPCLKGDFVWDDDAWTSGIYYLLKDATGLGLIWSKLTALQQYYPLTGTTFWIDYHLWGFWPLPYHVENVLLHAIAALLFAQVLVKLEVPGAWLAGAVFALHPLMVESAAWITERKNVLSLALYLAAVLRYGRFAQFWKQGQDLLPAQGNSAAKGEWLSYSLAWVLFLAACLSKTTALSLPAALLVLCWWKRGQVQWRSDVAPTLPFFAVGLALGLITWWLERNHLGARGAEWNLSLAERCLVAGRALWFYAGKIFWPANLCFIYLRWQIDVRAWAQWLWPVAAVAALSAIWVARKQTGRGPVAAVLFYVIGIFPALGFISAYFMRYSFVCDHWSYLPSLGLIALGTALVMRMAALVQRPAFLRPCSGVVLTTLGLLTYGQCQMYWNAEILYRTTLARNPGADLAHNNLGVLLLERRNVEEAMGHFKKALEIRPASARAHNNLANTLRLTGDEREAAEHYQKSLDLDPDNVRTCNNLAMLLASSADPSVRDGPRAVQLALRANELLGTKNPLILGTLAAAYAEAGRFPEAIATAEQAIVLAGERSNTGFADFLNMQRELYHTGSPFREQRQPPQTANRDRIGNLLETHY